MDYEPEITLISLTKSFIVVCNIFSFQFFSRQTNAKLFNCSIDDTIYQFAFEEDTCKIAVNSEDNSISFFQILDKRIQKAFKSPPAHFNKITGLIFFEKGKKLISCSHDEMIFIWNLETFEIIHQINQLKGKIQHLRLFHEQKFFTTISSEGSTLFYNLQNLKAFYCSNRIQTRVQEICGVKQDLMKNEKVLVQIDDKIKLISLNRQKILRVLQFQGDLIDAQFWLNDRAILLINYLDFQILDHQSGIILKAFPRDQNCNCFDLDKENQLAYINHWSHYQILNLSI